MLPWLASRNKMSASSTLLSLLYILSYILSFLVGKTSSPPGLCSEIGTLQETACLVECIIIPRVKPVRGLLSHGDAREPALLWVRLYDVNPFQTEDGL